MESLDTLYSNKGQDNLVPVFRELPADLETPVSVFLKLRNSLPCFLLESVERGEQLGRYSFIGTNPYLIVQTSQDEGIIRHKQEVSRVTLGMPPKGPDPLHLVQSLLTRYRVAKVPGLPRFFGGAVGYLSYDMVRFFERLPDCHDELHLPDSIFLFTDTLVIFDQGISKSLMYLFHTFPLSQRNVSSVVHFSSLNYPVFNFKLSSFEF